MRKDNFHEELRAKLLNNSDFVKEYNHYSLKLKVAEQLKKARLKSKLTLEDVATKMHTSATALSRLESTSTKSNPTLDTIENYLNAVGYHVELKIVKNAG